MKEVDAGRDAAKVAISDPTCGEQDREQEAKEFICIQ
jgi:hypothetical protein